MMKMPLGVEEENNHSMTTPLNRWPYGSGTTAHERGARRREEIA